MRRHKIPDLLRHVQGLSIPIAPPPWRSWRHTDVIDPIAETYAALFYTNTSGKIQAADAVMLPS